MSLRLNVEDSSMVEGIEERGERSSKPTFFKERSEAAKRN